MSLKKIYAYRVTTKNNSMLLKSGLCKEKEENSHAMLLAAAPDKTEKYKSGWLPSRSYGYGGLKPHCSESPVNFPTTLQSQNSEMDGPGSFNPKCQLTQAP